MSTVTVTVVPTLSRADGSALVLADLSGVEGFVFAAGADPSTAVSLGSQPPAASVDFVIKDPVPGDYSFFATETDTQNPPLTSAPSAIFNYTVPAVALAAPSAPSVSGAAVTP